MSGTRARRHFTGQEKVAILRRHLVERAPVSDLCEEHRINPTIELQRRVISASLMNPVRITCTPRLFSCPLSFREAPGEAYPSPSVRMRQDFYRASSAINAGTLAG